MHLSITVAPGSECLFGKLFLCQTINYREGSQGGEGASLQERGAKGSCTTHGLGGGEQTKLIRFFLDDKYVR